MINSGVRTAFVNVSLKLNSSDDSVVLGFVMEVSSILQDYEELSDSQKS